jgi:hypothetical protein
MALLFGLVVVGSVSAQEADTHGRPGEDLCSWTVVSVGPNTLSAQECGKGPKVTFPVETAARPMLKHNDMGPGAVVFLTLRETGGKRSVISIRIVKPGTRVPTGSTTTTTSSGSVKPVLYVRSEVACDLRIDDKPKTKLSAGGATDITVEQGQHVLTCVGEAGTWEQIVEPKGPRTVVDIKFEKTDPNDKVDVAAAGVWVALSDLRTAGAYAGSVAFSKSFGFHDTNLLAAIHAAHTSVVQTVAAIGALKPADPLRKRFLEESKRTGEEAKKYADLLAKAITMAQDKNTAMGEPLNLYGQAKALESVLTFSAEVMEGLRASQAFRDALPADLRAKAGLAADSKDVRIGADYCQSMPLMLAVVESGGVAAAMGFEAGDQLVSAAGKPLKSIWEFKLVLRENLGRKIQVAFTRKGKSKTAEVKVPGQVS